MRRKTGFRFIAAAAILGLLISIIPAEVFAASVPGQPAITRLKAASAADSVKISWSKADDAYGYSVYRAAKEHGPYTKICSTVKTSYTDTGISGSRTYYYKVKAYKYINGKRVYGLVSAPKSVVTRYSNPPIKIYISPYQSDTHQIRMTVQLNYIFASTFSPTTLIYSELKRPFASRKIFGILEKNAVENDSPTKSIYLKYDQSRYRRILHSTGTTSSDYKYMKLTKKYPSAEFYISALNSPLQGYNPQKDVLKFYVMYNNKSYVVRYDAVNGIRFSKM